MFSIVNSWAVYKQLQRHPNKPFLDFLCELAEALIAKGQEHNPVKRALRPGRKSVQESQMVNVGRHLPIEGTRRCEGFSRRGKETRTKICVGSVTARIAKRAFLCVTCNTIINCDCVVIACFICEQESIFMSRGTYVSHSAVTEKFLWDKHVPLYAYKIIRKNLYRQLD